MTRAAPPLAALLLAAALAPGARAAGIEDQAPVLDTSANGRAFATHFGRYGYQPYKAISLDARGVRFKLPAGVKNVDQTGLYSYFQLAGDFEVAAAYDLVTFPPPQGGYGVSVGIAVDSNHPEGGVFLARTIQQGNGPGYAVTKARPVDGKMEYASEHYPSKAKAGRLVLRRVKAELVCLVADGKDDLRELCRVPYTAKTVRQARLFADAGGSPTAVDARLGPLLIRGEELTGGVAKGDRPGGYGWWLALAVAALGAALALHLFRRRDPADDRRPARVR